MRLRYLLIPVAATALAFTGCNKADEAAQTPPAAPTGIPGTPGGPPAPGGPPMPGGPPVPGGPPQLPGAQAASGQQIFAQHCVVCHGPTGKGTRKGQPDFTNAAWHAKEDDAELIDAVTNGYEKGMPSFKKKLTEEQIRQVVSYIRTLPQKS